VIRTRFERANGVSYIECRARQHSVLILPSATRKAWAALRAQLAQRLKDPQTPS
jgi:hypothetical protein